MQLSDQFNAETTPVIHQYDLRDPVGRLPAACPYPLGPVLVTRSASNLVWWYPGLG
jgi:hypothetical protein